MALAGMDPAVAAERMGHTDGAPSSSARIATSTRAERRTQANRLDALVRSVVDENGTERGEDDPERVNHADIEDGRY